MTRWGKRVRRAEDVVLRAEGEDGRVGAVLRMEWVGDRRFSRLVVLRPRPVGELAWHEQSRHAFRVHDERTETGIRRTVDGVVRCVADPALTVPRDANARDPRVGCASRMRVVQTRRWRGSDGPLGYVPSAWVGARSPLGDAARCTPM